MNLTSQDEGSQFFLLPHLLLTAISFTVELACCLTLSYLGDEDGEPHENSKGMDRRASSNRKA